MSALGQKQTCAAHKLMFALPPKADMCSALAYVCFGPIVDIGLLVAHSRASLSRGGRAIIAPARLCVETSRCINVCRPRIRRCRWSVVLWGELCHDRSAHCC